MNLPDDLRDYKAPDDAFQIIAEDLAGLALAILGVLLLIFWPVGDLLR